MTVPGFVRLGALAVAFQLAVLGGLYRYLRHRRPLGNPAKRRRRDRLLLGGGALVALGQLVALGAIGSLRATPLLSFGTALTLQNAGLFVAVVGYVGVIAGVVVHVGAGE